MLPTVISSFHPRAILPSLHSSLRHFLSLFFPSPSTSRLLPTLPPTPPQRPPTAAWHRCMAHPSPSLPRVLVLFSFAIPLLYRSLHSFFFYLPSFLLSLCLLFIAPLPYLSVTPYISSSIPFPLPILSLSPLPFSPPPSLLLPISSSSFPFPFLSPHCCSSPFPFSSPPNQSASFPSPSNDPSTALSSRELPGHAALRSPLLASCFQEACVARAPCAPWILPILRFLHSDYAGFLISFRRRRRRHRYYHGRLSFTLVLILSFSPSSPPLPIPHYTSLYFASLPLSSLILLRPSPFHSPSPSPSSLSSFAKRPPSDPRSLAKSCSLSPAGVSRWLSPKFFLGLAQSRASGHGLSHQHTQLASSTRRRPKPDRRPGGRGRPALTPSFPRKEIFGLPTVFWGESEIMN